MDASLMMLDGCSTGWSNEEYLWLIQHPHTVTHMHAHTSFISIEL